MGGGGAGFDGGPFGFSGTYPSAEEIFREFFKSQGGGGGAGAGSPFADFFSSMGGMGGGGSEGMGMDVEGSDINATLQLSFQEAVHGVKKAISYRVQCQCSQCRGTGLKPSAKMRACTACGGSGQQMMQRAGFRLVVTCNTCGGSGRFVAKEDVCVSCRGEGRVSQLYPG